MVKESSPAPKSTVTVSVESAVTLKMFAAPLPVTDPANAVVAPAPARFTVMFVVASPVTTTLRAEELVKVCEFVAVPEAVDARTLNVSIPLAVRFALEVRAAEFIATVIASDVPAIVAALAQLTVVSELAETRCMFGMYEPVLPSVSALKDPLL
jgi:hypothetical protein